MEPKNLWELFEDTGDPLAYMIFKAAGQTSGAGQTGADQPKPPEDRHPAG